MTIGYEPNQTEGQSGTGQTKETEAFVWVRPNIPNSFIDQTEQTDNGLIVDQTQQTQFLLGSH